jgi:hypothetical protein
MNYKNSVLDMIDVFNYDREDHVLVYSRYDDDLRSYEVIIVHDGKKDIYCTLYNESFRSAEKNTYKLVFKTLIERAFLNYDRL